MFSEREEIHDDVKTFEDLEVWNAGASSPWTSMRCHQRSREYALKDQMQRSAISIPSNIAEGSERDSDKDFVRFLRYSKGSCGELRTQLYISRTNPQRARQTQP